ncbi:hypothetical protein BDY21DRAFT_366357 [Lineolata rhizophorae]|uniref:Uncharacterized protein n=1 Tax=Lineolata rhizophorae TaxID=578093 RepID=A0A6A6NR87_9PEZI|nr:hypothetical protein BDY21DRAFT_366357 [Lineolata rhizophorae]
MAPLPPPHLPASAVRGVVGLPLVSDKGPGAMPIRDKGEGEGCLARILPCSSATAHASCAREGFWSPFVEKRPWRRKPERPIAGSYITTMYLRRTREALETRAHEAGFPPCALCRTKADGPGSAAERPTGLLRTGPLARRWLSSPRLRGATAGAMGHACWRTRSPAGGGGGSGGVQGSKRRRGSAPSTEPPARPPSQEGLPPGRDPAPGGTN